MRLKIVAVWAFVLASEAPTAFAKELGSHFAFHGKSDSTIAKRADSTSAKDAASFNEAAFNASATQACNAALSRLTGVVNPSGIVACYNIPFYDNATGVFETDIRLYQFSQPVDEFAGTSPSDYMLSVSIPQAALSSPQTLANGPSVQNKAATGGVIKMLRNFQNVGQLSSSLIPSKLTASDLRILMIPNITLSATNPATSNLVTTTLSSDTLSYVAGEFASTNGTPTNITLPEAITLSSPIVTAAAKFVLPGMTIAIFPIGMIVTGIWTVLFVLTVGLGTYGRYRFRQQFRQRIQRAQISGNGAYGTKI